MAIKRKTPGSATPSSTNIPVSDAWEDAPLDFLRRTVFMHIYGDTGTGRTSLALTAPGPIGLVHCGEKIDGIVQKFARKKQVRMVNFGGVITGANPDEISANANPFWARATGAWYDCINNWGRSVVLDTDTEAWELIRLARFGLLNPKGRTDALYGPVNAEWKSLFKAVRAQDGKCNIITIGQTKDEYLPKRSSNGTMVDTKTGRTIRVGQKDIPIMADVVVRTSKSLDPTKGETTFVATIEKGWFNAHTEGLTFEGKDATFANIMAIITETDPSDWE